MRRLALALLLVATPAAAQVTTTNCHTDGLGNTYCTTNRQPGVDWSLARPNAPADVAGAWQRGRAVRDAREQAERRQLIREEVLRRARLGDCRGATEFAIRADDMALAQMVPTLCTPQQ